MELTQSVQTLGPGSTVPSGPTGIPWVSESPGSKGADQALKELTTLTHRGTVDPGLMEPRQARPGLRGSSGCWKNGASPTAATSGGLGCLPSPSRYDTSPARPRVDRPRPRARLPTADNLARGPDVRARARPRYQNISAARIRPARGAPSPLPAASSLKAPRSPLVRPRTGSEIPVTGLAFHLRNRVIWVIPGPRKAQLGSARPRALGPLTATHCHPQPA